MKKPEVDDSMYYIFTGLILVLCLGPIGAAIWLISQIPKEYWFVMGGVVLGFLILSYLVHGVRWIIWKIKSPPPETDEGE